MIEIRRVFTHVEHIHHEFGPRADTPLCAVPSARC